MSRAMIEVSPDILFYAFRYALGRRTYAVLEVVNAMHEHWDSFDKFTRIQIHSEIKKAINEDRSGADIDTINWETILRLKIDES